MARHKRRRPMAEINVVPYIDVMLVLLVIFMVTAPMLSQGVKVDLPRAAAEPTPQSQAEPLVITVTASGEYHINLGADPAEALAAEALALRVAALKQLNPDTPVYLRGDRTVAYGKVVAVMALLQNAGVEGVGLLTEPLE